MSWLIGGSYWKNKALRGHGPMNVNIWASWYAGVQKRRHSASRTARTGTYYCPARFAFLCSGDDVGLVDSNIFSDGTFWLAEMCGDPHV